MSRSHEELKEKVGNFGEKAVAFLGLSLCFLAVALLIYAVYEPPPYAPLGPYPEQTVTAQFTVTVDGVEYPAFAEGEAIPVSGEKCADEATEIIGSVQWQTREPAGTFIPAGTGTRTGKAGCTTFNFVNEMPQEVIDANRDIRAEGFETPIWVVSGIETPINPDDGENGESQTWNTEPFVIVDAAP